MSSETQPPLPRKVTVRVGGAAGDGIASVAETLESFRVLELLNRVSRWNPLYTPPS